MKRTPLTKIINDHFNANLNVWIKKVDLFVLANEYGFSPETTCPLLRRMERNGEIIKGKYDGKYAKNLVQYLKGKQEITKTIYEEVEIDGERKMVAKQQKVLV